ncbi:DUF2282 domain-containing protein [Pelomonas sp. V22]|uniref:BufA1 family periplasmic bufferin-type metallophore n=1 Tax=Pelomonas sp. V22 TaxID=2822139 RepID=UPI0024A90EA2|nr:DUF2282 domain-containing protein [Pelomonas sp. V22]MDI4631522.1 DUF2282 domain-containing protein [Pelomonas sp. V22]
MQTKQILSSALAAALSLGLAQAASAHDAKDTKTKEKCYGIAKAGQNDCSNLSGSHSCAGLAKADNVTEEWNYVDKGSCKAKGGMSTDEAKAKLKAKK